MKFTIASSILFVLLFAVSCVPIGNQSAPAVSPTAKPIVTKAATATATETPTPEPTATPEVKTYQVCTPEEFRKCKIDLEKDLLSGDYAKWVKANFHVDFDPSEINTDLFLHEYALYNGEGYGNPGNVIMYDIRHTPNFKDLKRRPFKRGVTAAVLTITNNKGESFEEAIIPVLFYNPEDPAHNILVMTAISFEVAGHKLTPDEEKITIDDYMNKMNIAPIGTTTFQADLSNSGNLIENPLLKMVFDNHPDMRDRFLKVTNNNSDNIEGQSLKFLDNPTIIVGTDVKVGLKWYK